MVFQHCTTLLSRSETSVFSQETDPSGVVLGVLCHRIDTTRTDIAHSVSPPWKHTLCPAGCGRREAKDCWDGVAADDQAPLF